MVSLGSMLRSQNSHSMSMRCALILRGALIKLVGLCAALIRGATPIRSATLIRGSTVRSMYSAVVCLSVIV